MSEEESSSGEGHGEEGGDSGEHGHDGAHGYEAICEEYGLPTEGAISDANSSVNIDDWDEAELADLEQIVEPTEEDHVSRAHAHLENRIKRHMGNKKYSKPTKEETTKALWSLVKDVPRNATGMIIGKYLVDRDNHETLEGLAEGDKVMVVMHGYMQNQGAYLNFVRQAKAMGYKVIALGWKFSDFEQGGEAATHLAKEIFQKTGEKPIYMGHSDGAKALLHGAQSYGLDRHVDKFVFMEGDINHAYTDLPGQIAIGGLPPDSNLNTVNGKKGALYNNAAQLETDVYVVHGNAFGDNDGLVRIKASTYTNAADEVTMPTTHFGMAGTNPSVNRLLIGYAAKAGWEEKNATWNTLGRTQDRATDASSVSHMTKSKRAAFTPKDTTWYN